MSCDVMTDSARARSSASISNGRVYHSLKVIESVFHLFGRRALLELKLLTVHGKRMASIK